MNNVVVQQSNLPSTLEDLSNFVLVGREKLTAVRAEIRAINKLQLAEDVREQKKEEAQMLAEALLDAEVRIGDLLKQIPKLQGARTDMTSSQQCEKVKNTFQQNCCKPKETKQEVITRLGFNKDQANRFETLSSNKEIVEQVKAEARENEDIPTRSRVLQLVKEKTKEEKDNEYLQEQFREIERIKGTEIRMQEAIFKILTVEVNEENVQIWIDGLDDYMKDDLTNELDEAIEKYKFIKEMWLKNNRIRRIK